MCPRNYKAYPNEAGPDSFTYNLWDGQAYSNIATVTINVTNQAPVATDLVVETNEDTVGAVNLSAADPEGDPLTYMVVTGPNHGTLSGTGPYLIYNPEPDWNGTDSFTFKANDGMADSNVATVFITVISVNDAPNFTASDPDYVDKNAGGVVVPNWATFSPEGGSDEENQTPTYIVTNVSNPDLFDVLPAVAANGDLSYTVAPELIGISTFDVAVQDNGGTANGGQDTSQSQTFTITVNSGQNTPPATILNNIDRANDLVVPARIPTLNLPGGTKRLNVRIGNQPATLTLTKTQGNTGSAFFDQARTLTLMPLPANQSTTVTIYGGDASDVPRNMRLTATVGGNVEATWNFTVFYVIPEAITTGNIDEKLPETVTNADNTRLRAMTRFTNNHSQLGFQFFDDTAPAPIAYGAIIIRGKISPGGMNSGDFKNNASRVDAFNWDRVRSTRTYLGNVLFSDPNNPQNPFSSENLSDDPDDTDEDLTPNNDLGGNDLYIWVCDVPSIIPGIVSQDGNTVRVRDNFNEAAYYGGIRVSQPMPWNWRVSATNPVGARTFVKENTYNNDNQLGINAAIWLTIDLAQPNVPNITVTGFNPRIQDNSTNGINFTIDGTNLNGGGANITQAYLIREVAGSTSLTNYIIPLRITNIAANALTGTFDAPVRNPDNQNLGLYDLQVFIDGIAFTWANAFRLR